MDHFLRLQEMVSSISFDSRSVPIDYNPDEFVDFVNEQRSLQQRIENVNSKLKGDCKSGKERLAGLEKERTDARKELNKLKEENAALDKKITKLKSEIRDAKHQINLSKNKASVSEKDQELLKKHQMEMEAYKDLTGIRFAFNTPENKIEGLITNSKKSFVKTFSLEKSTSHKKTKETLWTLIKEASTDCWDQIDADKENQRV